MTPLSCQSSIAIPVMVVRTSHSGVPLVAFHLRFLCSAGEGYSVCNDARHDEQKVSCSERVLRSVICFHTLPHYVPSITSLLHSSDKDP